MEYDYIAFVALNTVLRGAPGRKNERTSFPGTNESTETNLPIALFPTASISYTAEEA